LVALIRQAKPAAPDKPAKQAARAKQAIPAKQVIQAAQVVQEQQAQQEQDLLVQQHSLMLMNYQLVKLDRITFWRMNFHLMKQQINLNILLLLYIIMM
jgi:hypothetical protein